MKGPYFITTLEADVRIHPSQMNNNIMDNIKLLFCSIIIKCIYLNVTYNKNIYLTMQEDKEAFDNAVQYFQSIMHHTISNYSPHSEKFHYQLIIAFENLNQSSPHFFYKIEK